MSVVVRGMKMPTNCVDCRFHKGIYCTLTDICTNTAQRCPLVEIPPHGRLIDADELTDRLERGENNSIGQAHAYYRFAKAWVDEGKTVIEAEAGSGGGGDHAEEV